MDLIRALGLARIPCAVVPLSEEDVVRFTRFAHVVMPPVDPRLAAEPLVEELERFGARQAARPVLFYESDEALIAISEYRARLSAFFRFLLPDSDVVQALTNKATFQ